MEEERGAIHFSCSFFAGLRDSFNERGGLSTHDLVLERDGRTAERKGGDRERRHVGR